MTDTSIETVLTVIYDAFGTDLRRMAKNIEGNIYNFEILQSDNNVILRENSSLCSFTEGFFESVCCYRISSDSGITFKKRKVFVLPNQGN